MAKVFGANTIEVPDPGYVHDLDAMAAAITPQTKEIFIANPNNPTGTLVTQEQIDRFMAKVPDHVVVVFDEAYYEFLDNPPDTLKYVREGRNVVVLRTFSKIQGLAGTRIGYGIANKEFIDVLQRTRQPFNINSIAQAGALGRFARSGASGRRPNASPTKAAAICKLSSRTWASNTSRATPTSSSSKSAMATPSSKR
jgi:histidinol-phosphate aminotransferase